MLLYTFFGFGAPMCRVGKESFANLVSLVSTSLFIGYCTGAAILLRLDPGKRQELRPSQRDMAKDLFVRRALSEKREREVMKFLWDLWGSMVPPFGVWQLKRCPEIVSGVLSIWSTRGERLDLLMESAQARHRHPGPGPDRAPFPSPHTY